MVNDPTSTITIAIERPGQPVQTLTLSGARALVGRESGDIVLGDAEASALHAELEITGGAVIVRDLGSSNGTWRGRSHDGALQWERLPQFALLPGQLVRCGKTTLRLVEAPVAPMPGYGLEPGEVGKLVEFLRLVNEDGHATRTP